MARKKQRENYGNGSVSAVMVNKKDKDGNAVYDSDGKPVKVQECNKNGQPVWRVCLSLGTEQYVDRDGKLRKRQKKIQKRFAGTLHDARTYVKSISETYEQIDSTHAGVKFSDLVDAWAKSDEIDCSDRQLAQYKRLLGYVAVYLDEKTLVELRRHDVENALKSAMVRPNGKVLAPTTNKKTRAVVRRVFDFGVRFEYLPNNPCSMPKRKRYGSGTYVAKKRNALSEDDAQELRKYLDNTEIEAYKAFDEKELRQEAWGNSSNRSLVRDLSTISSILAIRLILATGVRRGEALGLEWRNVNLEKGTIRICQTLTEEVIIKKPKTDNGIRSLFIDAHTLEHLRKWKTFQEDALSRIYADGKPMIQNGTTPVFCSDKGQWLDPTNVSRWWREYRKGAGFDTLLIHELRHSQNTWLFSHHPEEEGLIKQRMGHSRGSSISLQYLHELPARDKHMAETIGNILYKDEVEEAKKKSPKAA